MSEIEEGMKRISKRRQALALHPYEIKHTEKSGFYTYVTDENAAYGKRLIRRCTKESLLDALVAEYLDNPRSITFSELYDRWYAYKRTPKNQENMDRISALWKAYYLNEELSRKVISAKVSTLNAQILFDWGKSLMIQHDPNRKKASRMFLIVNSCLEYAVDELEIIDVNPWTKARKRLNHEWDFTEPVYEDWEQVFTDEREQIKAMVLDDLKRYKKQASSAGLQILFLFQTELRIGECCGLKWSDIKDGRLYIRRQANNQRVKDKPKNRQSIRDIPLTDEALAILDLVRAFNEEHGFDKEWIFQSDNPDYDYRLSYNAADRKLRKLCKRMHSEERSPHKCRKTCISTLMDCENISKRTVQRFAGHKNLSTTLEFYTFERRSKAEQAIAINNALATS